MFSPCSSHKGSMCACQPFVIHVCWADWALPCFVWTTSFSFPCLSVSNYISPFGIISHIFFHILVWYVRACVFCLAGHLSHSVNPHDSYTPTPYHVLPVFLSSFLFSLPIANHLLMIMSLLKDEYILLWNQSHHIFACNWEQQNVLLISVADSLVAYRLKY